MSVFPPASSLNAVVRRRPALIAGAVGIAVFAVWWLTRGAGTSNNQEATEVKATPRLDSVVRLDSAAVRLAGIEVMTVKANAGSGLTANGIITYDANRVAVVAPRVEARVMSVLVDLGQNVPTGRVLATLESAEVGQVRGDLERARAAVDVAERNYDREKRLFEAQITPQKELLEAESALRSAQADHRSAVARLRAIGASETGGAMFGLMTQVAGTVVERNASPGQSVNPSTTLFTVADLGHVWINVDVYERDLTRVRSRAGATVTAAAFPGESFRGRVTYAGGVVDSASHTFKVRVEVDNPGHRLRPGMFAQVRIDAPASVGPSVISVPEVAVQDVSGRQVIFIAGDQQGVYEVRTVTTGQRSGDGQIEIMSGLTVGERIVVRGAFQLKAELTKASYGAEG